MTDIFANCVPHGATLSTFVGGMDVDSLEVRACCVIEDEETGDEHISPDATLFDIALFAIFIRAGADLIPLHDLEDVGPDTDLAAAQAKAIDYAAKLAQAVGLPPSVVVAVGY